MRILLYLPTPGGMTGAPRRLLTLASGLKDLGATPIIATEPGTELKTAAEAAGVETISFSPVGVLKMREGALFGGGALFRLRVAATLLAQQILFYRVARSAKADVIWMRGSKSIAFAGLGVLLARKPLVWDVDYELPSRGVVRHLHRLGLRLAKRVVFQHHAAHEIFGDDLARRYEGKFRVLTPGVALPALIEKRDATPPTPSGRFRILHVGTLCDRKNQSFSLRILRHLPEELRNRVELTFVGGTHSEAYERELHAQVKKQALCESIRFLGWRDDVHDLMLDSDLLLMPSKDEGVPNTVQEAMVLGLPVLASDQGGIPEVLETGVTGWVLPLSDANHWAETLSGIMRTPEQRSSTRERALRFAEERFGTPTWCHNYLAIMGEVAEKSAKGGNR